MIKFIISPEYEISFLETITKINPTVSPFKEILNKEDVSSFSLSIKEEETLSFNNVFILLVNIKEVGSINFIFNKDNFNKKEIINEISKLKELEVNDLESAKNKINQLLDIANKYKPLFLIYKNSDNTKIDEKSIYELLNERFISFIIREEEKIEPVKEELKEEDNKEEKEQIKKGKKDNILKDCALIIKENKFHFLLLLISTLLFTASIPLGIFYIYASNALYVFLFICAAIGLGMDFYAYYDFFKTAKIKDLSFILSALTNLIGVLLGLGGFILFYNISKTVESAPALSTFILMSILIGIISSLIAIVAAYFIPKKKKKVENNKG